MPRLRISLRRAAPPVLLAGSLILSVATYGSHAATTTEPDFPSTFTVRNYLRPAAAPASAARQAPYGLGNFRALCEPSHLAYDDPIVAPGKRGATHLHMFFGNTAANAFSTYKSLRTTGNSTCSGGPLNRSAYWVPALIAPGSKVVMPDDIAIYYKNGSYLPAKTTALPRGLRMIAGYDMKNPTAKRRDFDWSCSASSAKRATVPNCPRGQKLIANVRFPSCWNGKQLDSPNHRSHMAYARWDGSRRSPICPTTHPVVLPEIAVTLIYPNLSPGKSSGWYLSSDRMPGMTHANGSTMHADWFGAWDSKVANTFVQYCIRAMKDCKTGDLGNRTRLIPPRQWRGGSLIPVPAKPVTVSATTTAATAAPTTAAVTTAAETTAAPTTAAPSTAVETAAPSTAAP